MDRRQFLATNAAAGLLAAAPVNAAARTASGQSLSGAANMPPLARNPGIDRDRAAYILREMGLDALILSRVENVRYTTGAVPVTTKLGFLDASFAIVPADPTIPVGLLVLQFPYYFSVADNGLCGGVVPHMVALGPSTDPFIFGDDPITGPTKRELARRRAVTEAGTIHPDFAAALKTALPASVLGSGTIGFDTIEAMQLIERAAPGAKAASGESAIRHMRLIKTEWEIAAMSRAAQINREAAHLAAKSMRGGETLQSIQRAFFHHAITLGNKPEFIVVDAVVAENNNDTVRDGACVLIDCVSSRDGYHGDYGRPVFVGEPRKEIAGKAKAIGAAWSQLRDELRPGQTFSEISARGSAILATMDPSLIVPFGPHSVGLKHTEQPSSGLDGAPLDIALRPGMILSVDCPLLESSQQGTVHLEDLVLITDDGARPIHSAQDHVIIV